MKLSVEAKVAAGVAASFIALTAAAISEKGAEAQSVGPNNYRPIDNHRVNTQITEQTYKSFLSDQTSANVQGEALTDHSAEAISRDRHTQLKHL